MSKDEALVIRDALAVAGLKRSDFLNVVQRGLYPSPPTERGRPRMFNLNELVAAYVLGWLFERGVQASVACEMAVGVLDRIRKNPKHETLTAWKCLAGGEPFIVVSPRAPRVREPIELFRFNVGEIRRRMLADIRQKQIDDATGGTAGI